jgi:hypothetical protein
VSPALAAIRQALDRRFDNLVAFTHSDLRSLQDRPEFLAMVGELERRRSRGMSQAP